MTCRRGRCGLRGRYAHPIESLRPVVDLNTMKVLRVEEYDVGKYPIPPQPANYASDRIDKVRCGRTN
eukprot:5055450-Pyramimonas_sp.AAC.2